MDGECGDGCNAFSQKNDSVINVKVEFGEGECKVPLDNIAKRAEAYKPKERVTYKIIRVIGGLSKKYYQLVYEGCAKNQTYTYELRSGSKAEKIFLSNYPKNSLQRQKIDERVALKELLVYFRNSKDSNSFTRFLDGIEPLELDIGLVNEYIQEICKGIVPQSLIDEVEYLYEENEYSVERL